MMRGVKGWSLELSIITLFTPPFNDVGFIKKRIFMQAISTDFLAAAMAATPARLNEAMAVLKGDCRLTAAPQPKVHEPFVTLEALSKITGIGRVTLWRYNVPGHKHAGRMRYRVSEVLDYLETPQFRATVKALQKNGWKRPTTAELTTAEGSMANANETDPVQRIS